MVATDAEKTYLCMRTRCSLWPSCDNEALSVEPSHSTIGARNNIIITKVTEHSRNDLVRGNEPRLCSCYWAVTSSINRHSLTMNMSYLGEEDIHHKDHLS